MSAYKFASLSLVTLLALSGCGSGEEVTPNTTPPASPMAVEAEETTFDLEAILEEEPVIFNEWRTAEPGSTGEAEAEAELDAIYESLEEEYGELDDLDSLSEELEGLALVQYMRDLEDDPWANIPDDAPIHDMDTEEDVFRHMFDCDEDESVDACEQRYGDEIAEDYLKSNIEMCDEYIAEYEETGTVFWNCSGIDMPNSEFYQVFEERTGYPVPGALREEDATLEEEPISFESCEDADFHWGGLMNDDLDGLDIDDRELADTEAWMQENRCW